MTTVAKSSVIHFPIETVWQKIRDFNALPSHHPAVAESHIEDDLDSDSIGCVRCFNLKQGGTFRERLVTLDDQQHTCAYAILESPIPVTNYLATIRLLPMTESKTTLMEWTAEFDTPSGKEAQMYTWVVDVFEDGFRCLENMLDN